MTVKRLWTKKPGKINGFPGYFLYAETPFLG
jgi:hypothetical protein